LVSSRRRHPIDLFAYLKDIRERLPTHPTGRLGELVPEVWIKVHPQDRRKVAL